MNNTSNAIDNLNDNDLKEMQIAFEYYLKDLYEKEIEKFLKIPGYVPSENLELSESLLAFDLKRIFSENKKIDLIISTEFSNFIKDPLKARKIFLFYLALKETNNLPSLMPTGKLSHLASKQLEGLYNGEHFIELMNQNKIFKDIDEKIIDKSTLLSNSEINKLENKAYRLCFGKSYRFFYIYKSQRFVRYTLFILGIRYLLDFINVSHKFLILLTCILSFYLFNKYIIKIIIKSKYNT